MHHTRTNKKLRLHKTTIRHLSEGSMRRIGGGQDDEKPIIEGDTGDRNLICLGPSIKIPCSYLIACR